MKHLVNTNLETVGAKDFRSIYTPELKKAQLDYANGREGSSPVHEQNYVRDKFEAAKEELPDEITVLEKFNI